MRFVCPTSFSSQAPLTEQEKTDSSSLKNIWFLTTRTGLWNEIKEQSMYLKNQKIGYIEYNDGSFDGEASIDGLYVHPSHRRQGLARKLMEKALLDIRKVHHHKIYI